MQVLCSITSWPNEAAGEGDNGTRRVGHEMHPFSLTFIQEATSFLVFQDDEDDGDDEERSFANTFIHSLSASAVCCLSFYLMIFTLSQLKLEREKERNFTSNLKAQQSIRSLCERRGMRAVVRDDAAA